jgi:DNA-binding beta-propeller fold protein YncE
MKSLILLSSTVLSCVDQSPIVWKEISQGTTGKNIAANSQSDAVWIISSWYHSGGSGNAIAYLDTDANLWREDKSQPSGAHSNPNTIAVNEAGQPAFIDRDKTIHWKKDDKWLTLDGCANMIAFGGEGSFFKADCNDHIFKYVGGKWESLGEQEKAFSFAADAAGVLWIVDYQYPYHVHKWDNSTDKWKDMGLE